MYPVTDAFKTAIYATSRELKGKAEFEILDVDSAEDATPIVISEEDFSKKIQLYNGIRQMSGKYATFEDDYWLLDGSFSLPPKPTETGFEVGWWSDALSQSNKTYAVSQVCTTDFTKDHSSIGITITFDVLTNEYAEDFTIVAKDSVGSMIHTEIVTGNTLSTYILEENLSNYRQIIITITKWCKAYRRARITEIDFGIIKQYIDDDIINMNVLEEFDTISNQVTSNEMKLTLNNKAKLFNILNPNGVYPYLQRRQKLKGYYGIVIAGTLIEYVPLGIYYLTEWKSDEGALTATFTARDILDILDQDKIAETTYTSKSLTYILEDILDATGVTDYVIDSALDSIIVTGTFPEASRREIIQTTAIAGMAVVYSDRSGILQIKKLTAGISVDSIDFDNVYNSPQIKLDKLINTVNVKYGASTYTLVDPSKPSDEQTLSITIDNPLIGTLEHAEDVANWILSEVKKRFLYEINWRQNPALEIGDVVTVEDDYSEDKTIVITKQDFSYQGYLSGKTSGKGGA